MNILTCGTSWKKLVRKGEYSAAAMLTNGYVNKENQAEVIITDSRPFIKHYPNMQDTLTLKLIKHGNVVHSLGQHKGMRLVSFPVKGSTLVVNGKKDNIRETFRVLYKPQSVVPAWKGYLDVRILIASCISLAKMAKAQKWESVLVPDPSKGDSGVSRSTVIEIMNTYLDEKFFMHQEETVTTNIYITGSKSTTSMSPTLRANVNALQKLGYMIFLDNEEGVGKTLQQYLMYEKYPNVIVLKTGRHDEVTSGHDVKIVGDVHKWVIKKVSNITIAPGKTNKVLNRFINTANKKNIPVKLIKK